MNWLFFALLTPAIFTVVNFADKYIVMREVRDPKAMPIYAGLVAAIYGTIFWLGAGMPVLATGTMLLTLFKGSLIVVSAVLYFHALSAEETSSIIILGQTTPVFVLVFSLAFLGEVINVGQLAGFALILAAAIGVSLARSQASGKFELSPSFFMMTLANLNMAISIVLAKSLLDNNNFWDIVAYESWGLGLGGLALYLFVPSLRRPFNASARNKRAFAAVFTSESIFTVAKLSSFAALDLGGKASLVAVLNSTSIFYGLLYGFLLMSVAPAVFHEDTRRKGLLRKGGLAAVMFVGVVMVG